MKTPGFGYPVAVLGLIQLGLCVGVFAADSSTAGGPTEMSALERIRMHSKLGRDELRLGDPTAAIVQYQAGLDLVPRLAPAQRRAVTNMFSYHLGVGSPAR